jgi:hypothetical protein
MFLWLSWTALLTYLFYLFKGAIYCSRECELQDRLSAYPSLSSASVATSQYPLSGNMKFEKPSAAVKFAKPKATSIQFGRVQHPPQQQTTLFYHRGPMPRYKHTTSKACASASNVRDRKMTKSLYVQWLIFNFFINHFFSTYIHIKKIHPYIIFIITLKKR